MVGGVILVIAIYLAMEDLKKDFVIIQLLLTEEIFVSEILSKCAIPKNAQVISLLF
jgi:hypothetical protein